MKYRNLAALAAVSSLFLSATTVAAETKVALCEYCNSAAFRNAAEVTALAEPPQLHEGTQYVFVVDIGTDEIRYYEVVRENVEICQSSQTAATSMSTLDPNDPGPEVPECFSNWVTSSTQLTPPADELSELREAQEAFDKFVQETQDFELSELPIGIIPLDSATDLIGPGSASHDPQAFRNALQNALSTKIFDVWEQSDYPSLSNIGQKMFGEQLDFENMDSITVTFPNGTSIEVEVEGIVHDEFGNFKGLKLKVDTTSAAGDDQVPSIPTTAAGFISFFQNGYTGDPAFVENLSDLFVRGGGRVITGPSTGACTATIMCWIEDGEEVCQESYPDPQLSSC